MLLAAVLGAPSLKKTGWVDQAGTAVYDSSTGMLKEQNKRVHLLRLIANQENTGSVLAGPQYDIYQFGVYTGGGLKAIASGTKQFSIQFGNLWGFDSFQGLPDSNLATYSKDKLRDRAWQAGGLNAAEQLHSILGDKAYDFTQLSDYIVKQVGYPADRTTLVQGFFNESLPNLSRKLKKKMQPAMLVDIDCDIYEGTVEALRFMIDMKLLVPGSIIYYDDWQASGQGERKAHEELTAEFKIVWRSLKPEWKHDRGTVRDDIYQVVSIERT